MKIKNLLGAELDQDSLASTYVLTVTSSKTNSNSIEKKGKKNIYIIINKKVSVNQKWRFDTQKRFKIPGVSTHNFQGHKRHKN